MRRWSRAKTGEGRVVLLSGEAGIGKSRLSAALMEEIAAEPHTRLRYFCSPQHTDSTLYPIIGQFERAAGLVHSDTPQIKLDKLRVATPQEFAALYDPMQVDAHEDAVSLFERYSKRGENPNLKNWAGKTLEMLKSHLVMAIKMNEDRRSTVGSSKTAPAPTRMDRK